jgi:hypothetical protein
VMTIDDEGEGVQNALKFDDVIYGRTHLDNWSVAVGIRLVSVIILGGTRGNAVPTVRKLSGRMGTA